MRIAIRVIQVGPASFIAECPALPGCRARARTPAHARRKLADAVCGYVAAVSNFVPDHLDYELTEA